MKLINASGKNYEIGYKIGLETSEEIKKVLKKNKRKFNKKIFNYCKKIFPELIDELKGMAVGANVNFEELFALNTGIDVGCTTIALKTKSRFIMGHNEDLSDNDVFLLRITHESGVKSLSLCYYAFLPGFCVSMNSEGFIQAMNGMVSINDGKKVGIPNSFLLRKTIESRTIDSAIDIFKKVNSLRGFSVIFCKEKLVLVESCPEKIFISEQNILIHTNHYLFLKEFENRSCLINSVSRFSQAQTLINFVPKNFYGLKKILSSHYDVPNNICRHEKTRTAATIIINSKKYMNVCYGNPCENKFNKFFFDSF